MTIFAYSAREGWEDKLDEDLGTIHKHGHACDEVVFLTNGSPTAGEKDKKKKPALSRPFRLTSSPAPSPSCAYAEHSAIASMVTGGEQSIRKVVAVLADGTVLPPCGRRREFMRQGDTGNMDRTEVLLAGIRP